jgi:hypothetical protein
MAETGGSGMSIEEDVIKEAIVALYRAEKQFTAYAQHHRAKGSLDKAATNYGYALSCGRAFEKMKLVYVGVKLDLDTE